MSDHPTDPRAAIALHLQADLPAAALPRILATHPRWHVPMQGPNGQPGRLLVQQSDEGKRYVQLFTDAQAAHDCIAQVGAGKVGAHFADLPGAAVFQGLDPELDYVDINPLSPSKIHYTKEQIPMLVAWGTAVAIEQTLAEFDDSEQALSRLKHHRPFFVVASEHEGRPSLMMAPDDEGRRLAAVFTAEDTRDAFLKRATAALQKTLGVVPRVLELSGQELCRLLINVPLDGIVFNCLGPVPPTAFSAEIIKMMRDAP
jgi:hypothetical protein